MGKFMKIYYGNEQLLVNKKKVVSVHLVHIVDSEWHLFIYLNKNSSKYFRFIFYNYDEAENSLNEIVSELTK
jgi:hypothetical protein